MSPTQSQEVILFKAKEFKTQNFAAESDGVAFMQFATSLALDEFRLSEADVQAGVMEGKDDGGIDGFHVVVNRTEVVSESTRALRSSNPPAGVPKNVPFDVVVLQSKSSQGGLDGLALPHLHEALDLILGGASRAVLREYPMHNRLVSHIEAYRSYRKKLIGLDPIRSFTVFVMQPVSEDKISGPAKRGARALRQMIEGHLGSTTKVRVEILGADGMEKLRTSIKDVEGTLHFAGQPIREVHQKSEALLGLVPVKDLLSFVRRGKTKVLRDEFFTTNVRDFAGSSAAINSAIRATLGTNSPTSFWWMNNGITVIVDKATYQSDDTYLLANPQIVNGLQTTNVIHEASSEGTITAARLKESVLVRVISDIDPAARETVIQGTNNQAPVTSVQLWANDALQLEIETYLETHGWFYERRRWQFRGRKVARSKIRSITELAQVVIAAVLLEPDAARARPRNKLDSMSGYQAIFSKTVPFALYVSLLNSMAAVSTYLQTPAARAIAEDPTNDRFYLLTALALRQSGVKQQSDHTAQRLAANISVPDTALLEGLHKDLYKLVGNQPNKKAADRLFKGTALREALIAEVLKTNP